MNKILLQHILDFMGTDGVVRKEYYLQRDILCALIRDALDGAEHKERAE